VCDSLRLDEPPLSGHPSPAASLPEVVDASPTHFYVALNLRLTHLGQIAERRAQSEPTESARAAMRESERDGGRGLITD
jgi:hypothetical protein